MFHLLIVYLYYHHHLLLPVAHASSLLFTLEDVRYSLSDRILTIPKLGAIRGIQIDYEHDYHQRYNLVNVEAFLGLQYGLYHERFEPSKERFDLHSTGEVKKQIEFGPACAQHLWSNESEFIRMYTETFVRDYYPKLLRYVSKQDEEQCLYMNIYQPSMKDVQERLPVLLFVHGDGYETGTGAAFDGAVFASYSKSIVLTINYRLGPFGFLYVSRENKGNYALQDIYTALHWLKNYISHFNGDPDRITVYGTGSGAVLASLVVMLETVNGGTGVKKRRKSLVHRLILNDQTFLSPSMTSTLQEIISDQPRLLASLSCSSPSCLRNRTLISTADLLQLHLHDANDERLRSSIRPLEDPFPFEQSSATREDQPNPLRLKFFQQPHRLLPENLHILVTTSSSITRSALPLPLSGKNSNRNHIIEYLINYAYTRWNASANQFEFDQSSLSYHQQIIAPLLEYAKAISNDRTIHVLERSSKKYQSELPFTLGYVLAPSMSVYNDTYLKADETDRQESMRLMDLFANLIHTGDINVKSPFAQKSRDEKVETWLPIFPDLNFILLNDGQLSQERGHHVQVHYLFNNLISNLFHQPLNVDLLHAWKTLYQVSSEQNISTVRAPISHRSLFNKPLPSEMKNLKSIFLLTLMIFCLIILNFFICIFLTRRGHGCRKREYNCLDVHTPFNLNRPSSPLQPAQQPHSGSSPSSTNSNGTITQQLMVNTNCTTTTNSSLSSTPPVDILHPINITKKNGILRSSSRRRASLLPEAIV